jgi:hypothetical protein
MKRVSRNVLIGGLACVMAPLLVIVSATPWTWLRLGTATVSLDGRPTALAAVYRSHRGQLLVSLQEPAGDVLYVIRTSERRVMVPNASAFLQTARFALSRQVRPIGVPLGSSKTEGSDPRLVIQPRCVEFTSLCAQRVRMLF